MANFSHAIFVVKRTTDKDNENRLTNKFHRFPHPRTWNDITFFGACSFDPFCTKQFPVLNNSIHQRHRGSAELNILVECDHRKRRTKTSSFFFCAFSSVLFIIFSFPPFKRILFFFRWQILFPRRVCVRVCVNSIGYQCICVYFTLWFSILHFAIHRWLHQDR